MTLHTRTDRYDSLAAWQVFLHDRPLLDESNPYARVPLTAASRYLYTSSTSPLPCAVHVGVWFSYPGLRPLINHLKNVVLTAAFSTWLCRDEWDPTFSQPSLDPIPLDRLFAAARAHGIPYASDIPLMEQIVRKVDEGTWEALLEATALFNDRWSRTSTWEFHIRLFDTVTEMGQHLWETDACSSAGSYDEDEWRAFCERSLHVADDAARLLDVIGEACAL